MKFKGGMFLIFLGSVFFTSEKFVETENAVKFYFTVLALFVGVITLLLKNNNLNSEVQRLSSISTLKGLFIVGILQAIYGILQYIDKYPSNHKDFSITGSFDNPAGFIAVLSLLSPIGVYWCIKSKRLEQRLIFFSVGLILFSIILAGSRTGVLAVVFSTIVIFVAEFQLFSKIKNLKSTKLTIIPAIIVILLVSFIFYKWREDSSNGRLLIWRVSTEMIKDKPLLGYGHSGFHANYMDYQARYFKVHPQSKYRQLADNVKHPFNEFIKITVNYGIIGLLFYLSLLGIILWKTMNTQNLYRSVLIGVYISFIILSCFSYPLQYAPIWFLLGCFILVLFSKEFPKGKMSIIGKIHIIGISVAGIAFFSFKMYNEMQWKTIAVKSLQGQTQQMLPQYERLYPYMRNNALFLYNYGAELNLAKQHRKSITLLNECQVKFNDYDLQMLLADNFYHIGDTLKSIQTYQHAANMIPCRFLPLYREFEIYKDTGNINEATSIAQKIVGKQIKVNTKTVVTIIERAENYLNEKRRE
ncbi:MAG: O-antigen ligase family protein [Mangrovibacterium sp.]